MTRRFPCLPALAAGLVALLATAAQAMDLQAAIRAAKPGDTLRVPAGQYVGPITIDKPLTLVADRGAVLRGRGDSPGQAGDVVVINAEHVTLRGFVVRGTGSSLDQEHTGIAVRAGYATIEDNTLEDVLFGIYLRNAPHSVIRRNTVGSKPLEIGRRGDAIRLWYSSDCTVEANRVDGGRDVVMWFSNRQRVLNNVVTNSRYGLHFMFSDDDLVEGNHTENNSVGTYMMYSHNLTLRHNRFIENRGPSGYGVGLKDVDGLDATDNLLARNRIGLYIDNAPAAMNVRHVYRHNTFYVNDIGVAFLPNVRRNTFTENNFVDNLEQVAILGSGELRDNAFSLDGRGNFWSDYRGYDRAGRGVGAVPYRSEGLFENLMDRQPRLRFFLYSPSQQAVEFAAQAFPAFRPRAKFVDEHPLMEPVAVSSATLGGTTAPWWAIASAMGLSGAALGHRQWRRFRANRRVERAAADHRREVLDESAAIAESASVPAVLRVRDLTRRFGALVAVDRLSFDVRPGEAVALWGQNGAGKTTAIKCILGLLRGRGSIGVCGHSARRKAARRAIGYVPQELGLYADMTARGLLEYFAGLKDVPKTRAATVLAEVGLADHGHKDVRKLSGGMRQRLALAVALLADPPLLVLDEMTSSLDARARRDFIELLNRQKAAGKAILFITHRRAEVEALADRVLVLERGRLKRVCGPDQVATGSHVRLKVLLAEAPIAEALAVLRRAGYAASPNGRGVYVRVAADGKARPVHDLMAHGIVVRDFQLDDGPDDAEADRRLEGPEGDVHGNS